MKFYRKFRPAGASQPLHTLGSHKTGTAQQRERNSGHIHTHPMHKKKHRAAARAKFWFEFWITMCSVNSPKPFREAHFSKNAPFRSDPGRKNAPRRGESAPSRPRMSTSGTAPRARRTRFCRRAAATTHQSAPLLPLVQFLIQTDQPKPRTQPEAPGGNIDKGFAY